MKLNKILFFPCLCVLLLGMVDAVHAWPGSTKDGDAVKTLSTSTYGGTKGNPYSLSSDQPPKWRKVWEEVEKKAPYYGMRATLPVYSLLTNRSLCTGGGFLLGVMLGGGVGLTSLVGGVAGAVAGKGIAWKLQRDTGGSWMRAYLKSASKADIDENVATTNALLTFKTFAKHQTLLKGIQSPKEFVEQEMRAMQEKQG